MNSEPLRSVADEEVERFASDGVIHLKGVADAEWIEALRRGVDKSLKDHGPLSTVQTREGETGFFLSDICMAQQHAEYRDFMLNGPAPAIAARLMKSPRVNFFADTLWVKDGGTPKRTRWHQDQPYFWVDGRMAVIWWPLDPVGIDSALELVRGSHKWGRAFSPELSKDGRDLYGAKSTASFARMPDIDGDRASFDIARWDVAPGDCIAFDGMTVHGAAGNTAEARRRAVSSIWLGDGARYRERPSPGRPHFEGHGLKPGDSMDCGYFPRVWPRTGRLDGAAFPRFTDPGLKITN
jgi:ectoine hydroxylase-related dioxygenase (phytanoyl-CoA dioxygenase family)